MEPIIGITCGHSWQDPERFYVNASYIRAIEQAGGTPILIPHLTTKRLESIVNMIDGLLVPGGIDIDPLLFNDQPHPKCGEIDPIWDELDITVIRKAMEREIPILAICRGMQVLNVAMGGDLIQDIPSQVNGHIKHTQQSPKWHATHRVTVKPKSLLSKALNAGTVELHVNSFHHQAVKKVAPGFIVSAEAADGVIEAIEYVGGTKVLGVQWHPELMLNHYPHFRNLFSMLVSK